MLTRPIILLIVLFVVSRDAFSQESFYVGYPVADRKNAYSHPLPSGWEQGVFREERRTNIHPKPVDGMSDGIRLEGTCYASFNSVADEARLTEKKKIQGQPNDPLFPPMRRLSRSVFVTKRGVKGVKTVYCQRNDSDIRETSYIFPARNNQLIAFTFRQASRDDLHEPSIDAAAIDAIMRALYVY